MRNEWNEFKKGKMLTYDSKYNPNWEYLTNMMLTYNPDKRPTFNEVLDKFKQIEKKMREEIIYKKNNPDKDITDMKENEKANRV